MRNIRRVLIAAAVLLAALMAGCAPNEENSAANANAAKSGVGQEDKELTLASVILA